MLDYWTQVGECYIIVAHVLHVAPRLRYIWRSFKCSLFITVVESLGKLIYFQELIPTQLMQIFYLIKNSFYRPSYKNFTFAC